jgi:hypothetical protein
MSVGSTGQHPHAGPDWDPELEVVGTERGGRAVLIGLILLSVALAATAQLTLKHGMNQVTVEGKVPLNLGQPVEMVRRIGLNASVWAGLVIFVLSAAVWLVVLSRASLSFAYRFIMDQPISGLRYAGVALIIAGLLLISRTHQTA